MAQIGALRSVADDAAKPPASGVLLTEKESAYNYIQVVREGTTTELILNEELSWGCAGIAVCIQSMALAIAGIRASGTAEQKKRWLPQFTDPDRLVLGGLGLTESDPAQVVAVTPPAFGSDVVA